MSEEISYAKFRKQMQEIAFQKEKIVRIGFEKKDAHKKYREYHKIWEQKSKEYDKEVENLLKDLPSEV